MSKLNTNSIFGRVTLLFSCVLLADVTGAVADPSSRDAFIQACTHEVAVGSAFQCACIDEEISRRFKGAEREFLETMFSGGSIVSEEEATELSDDDQESLMDEGGKIAKECGVTPDH